MKPLRRLSLEQQTKPFTQSRFFPPALVASLVGMAAFLSLELVVYPGVIQRNLGLSAYAFALLPLVLRLLFGKAAVKAVPSWLQSSFLWLTTAVFGLLFAATLADYFVHPNYFFSSSSLHPNGFLPIGLLGSLASWLLVKESIFQQHAPWRVFFLPFWIFAFIFPHRWLFPETWIYIIREDSLVEYLTMLTYLLASIIAAITARRVWRLPHKKFVYPLARVLLLLSLILFSIGAFGIAGDEISWGQRILGIQTPDNLAEANTQGEFNWHNNRAVYGRIYHVYNAVSFVGMTIWIIRWVLMKFFPKTWLAEYAELTLPSWELVLFFLPTFMFTTLRTEPVLAEVIAWEETSELFLGAGFMMSALWIWRRVRDRDSK